MPNERRGSAQGTAPGFLRYVTAVLLGGLLLSAGTAMAASSGAPLTDWTMPPYASKLSQPTYKMILEKDVRIPVRDGSYLVADVYRPDAPGEKFPVITSMSVYLKDLQYMPHAGPYTHQERMLPEWWVPRGYVILFIDSRGTGKSPGDTDVYGVKETQDYYDAVEWAAVQPWSTGKVGANGVSYYAVTTWNVASMQPPSLVTALPWEGHQDWYRERAYYGGVFNENFYQSWWHDVMGKQLLEPEIRTGNVGAMNEDLIYKLMVNYLDGPWWDTVKYRAQPQNITIPLYSSGNWAGFNHTLRGNIEGYLAAASKNKRLSIHTGGRVELFYSEEGQIDQLRWYDHWLKGIDTGMMKEPPISLCIRTTVRECKWRFENEWPLKRTRFTKYYLTAEPAGGAVKNALHDMKLSPAQPTAAGSLTYDAGPSSHGRASRGEPSVSFTTDPLEQDMEITGPVNLVTWVSSETDDMDVFSYLRKINPDGRVETLTRGILKVSHRKLDPKKSTPYRPFHTHDEEQKLKAGEIVPIEVEIWPTSMIFQKGSRIRLDVQAHDGQSYFAAYHIGNNTIYTGGERMSYVLLPIVPAK